MTAVVSTLTPKGHGRRSGRAGSGAYSPDDMAVMQGAIEAVCSELGLGPTDAVRREQVARNVLAAYETGRRAPLYLVHAGLTAL